MKLARAIIGFAVAVATCALTTGANAQDAGQVSTQFNPAANIDRDRMDRIEPNIPERSNAPEAPRPSIEVAAPTKPSAVAAIELTKVKFEGATLAQDVLEGAVAPYLGSRLTRPNLQKVANAVSQAYATSDIAFYSVSIPTQVPRGGVLIVRVLEGRIGNYTIEHESRSTPTRLIAAHMRRLMQETPTHKSSIERTLSLLRDIPGQTIEAKLKSAGRPGEVTMTLNVRRKQVEVTLDVNNSGVTNVTSGVQSQLGIAVNGLIREGDTTRFSGYIPFTPDRYQFYSASHATPLGSNGTTLAVNGAYVRTRTRSADILGEAKQVGLSLSHRLIRSYHKNLVISASLDGTNSQHYFLDIAFGGFRTRAIRMGATWSAVGKTGGYGVSGTVSQGLDALGAKEIAGFSEAKFRKVNIQLTAVKDLGSGLSGKVTSRAQYTQDKLPTTERFSLGGEGAGMAYRVGTITADKAIAAGLEVGWKLKSGKGLFNNFQIFAYTDGALAKSSSRQSIGIASKKYSLASAGGGIRISPIKGWTAQVQIAVPVKSPRDFYEKKPRFFFSVTRRV